MTRRQKVMSMSRFDLRWIRRHPLRWLRIVWWQWTVALLIILKGGIITDDAWEVTHADRWWPLLLLLVAGVIVASALAPAAAELQRFTATVLMAVSLARATTYLLLWLVVDTSPTVNVLSGAFMTHWLLVACISVRWRSLAMVSGAQMTAQVAQDDRGTGGLHGGP